MHLLFELAKRAGKVTIDYRPATERVKEHIVIIIPPCMAFPEGPTYFYPERHEWM